MSEKLENMHKLKSETEIRLEKFDTVMEVIKSKLNDEEMKKVKAVVLYGSTARGEAKKSSDLDIHVDLEPYDQEVLLKIIEILQEEFTEIDFSFSSKNIIEGGRTAKLITAQKNPDKPAAWKFIHCRSEKEKIELDRILSEEQRSKH